MAFGFARRYFVQTFAGGVKVSKPERRAKQLVRRRRQSRLRLIFLLCGLVVDFPPARSTSWWKKEFQRTKKENKKCDSW
jgi:hypothetical protein